MNIQLISAPSVLGLRRNGVELMAKALLGAGLKEKLHATTAPIVVPSFNNFYSNVRDSDTKCLNAGAIVEYSKILGATVDGVVGRHQFAMVLGGDCSILIGIMSGLRQRGRYGLVFLDAHADFYEPEKSPTGEVSDMDLAIVTGRGPRSLTDINGLCPYVNDHHVVHIGQRDGEESARFGSRNIRDSKIKNYDLHTIRTRGIDAVVQQTIEDVSKMEVEGIWVHFDTDVLDDRLNPAVQYRLPGGMTHREVESIISTLLHTGKVAGLSVSIFNPLLDTRGTVANEITNTIARAFADTAIPVSTELEMAG